MTTGDHDECMALNLEKDNTFGGVYILLCKFTNSIVFVFTKIAQTKQMYITCSTLYYQKL